MALAEEVYHIEVYSGSNVCEWRQRGVCEERGCDGLGRVYSMVKRFGGLRSEKLAICQSYSPSREAE